MDNTIIEQMKTRPESIEEMYLDTPDDMKHDFENLVNLKTLHLRCISVMENVKIPDVLHNLPITELKIINVRAKYIIHFPELKRLQLSVGNLSKQQLTEDLALIYRHLNHLESLCIEDAKDLEITADIEQMGQLQNLRLYQIQMTGFPTGICRLKNLTRISLEYSRINHLNALTKSRSLKELIIDNCELRNDVLTELKGTKSLTQFRLVEKQAMEGNPTQLNLCFLKSNHGLSMVDISTRIVEFDSFKGLGCLKKLEIVCQEFSGNELSTILKHLKNLEDLKIKSSGSVLGIRSNQIWGKSLKCLELSFQKITGLDTLITAKHLKKLTIATTISCNMEELGALTQLYELSLQGSNYTDRPFFEINLLTKLTTLKVLKLQNIDIKDSVEISKLPQLQKLYYDMQHCKNVQPIALSLLQKFENLGTFVLQGTIINDSPSSIVMPRLEELSINEIELAAKDIASQHKTMTKFDKVKRLIFNTHEFDADILNKFTLLEELDIKDARVKNIEVLLGLPALKTLKARPEVMAKWKSKGLFNKDLTKEDISNLLTSDRKEDCIQGIHKMSLYTEINSSDKDNAVTNLFPNDFERVGSYSLYRSKTMRQIIQRYGDSFERNTLIEICQSFLQSYTDSYEHVLEVLQIFINRKDTEGQLWFIELFKQAYENYEAGQRSDEGSMYDLLIDKYLKKFEPKPLLEFLLWCDTDYYGMEYGDKVDVLFRPAFEKITYPEQLKKLLDRFKTYIQEQIESGNAEYIIEEELLEGYDDHPSLPLRGTIQRFKDRLEN